MTVSVFTAGLWVTKPGCEDEFAARWREMADWTRREISPEARGTLLRDRDRPNRFMSVGPWPSLEAINAWRAHPGFAERVSKMRDLLEEFSPMTLDDVTA